MTSISPIYANKDIIGYVATEEDITEIRNIDDVKTKFISITSHQLKTPPTIIKFLSEILLSGKLGKLTKKQKEYLNDIQSSNQRMIYLINALLDVSRIEMGSFTVTVKKSDPNIIVQNIISELRPVIDKAQLNLKTIFPEKKIVLLLDESLFSIIITNLITNAINYTSEGGNILIECKVVNKGQTIGNKLLNKDYLVFIVSDTGCGIPLKQQSQIFTKFFRASNAILKHPDGTGLGLYTLKSILNHSGGLIWFTSRENEGSTFYVAIQMAGMKAKTDENDRNLP